MRVWILILCCVIVGGLGGGAWGTPPLPEPLGLRVREAGGVMLIFWPEHYADTEAGKARVTAIDEATGKELWTLRGEERLDAESQFAGEDWVAAWGKIGSDEGLMVVEVRERRVRWVGARSFVVAVGSDFLLTEDGRCLELATGKVRWKRAGGLQRLVPAANAGEGAIVVMERPGGFGTACEFVKLRAQDGMEVGRMATSLTNVGISVVQRGEWTWFSDGRHVYAGNVSRGVMDVYGVVAREGAELGSRMGPFVLEGAGGRQVVDIGTGQVIDGFERWLGRDRRWIVREVKGDREVLEIGTGRSWRIGDVAEVADFWKVQVKGDWMIGWKAGASSEEGKLVGVDLAKGKVAWESGGLSLGLGGMREAEVWAGEGVCGVVFRDGRVCSFEISTGKVVSEVRISELPSMVQVAQPMVGIPKEVSRKWMWWGFAVVVVGLVGAGYAWRVRRRNA